MRAKRTPPPPLAHSSICRSPSELPKAAIGRRPMRSVVGPFPFGVGMVHDEGKADAAATPCPFEHLQVAVGIAESRDRASTDVRLDADGLAGFVVVEIE